TYPTSLGISVLLVIGAYSVVRRGGYVRWVTLSMAVIGSVLYVVVASSPFEILRYWFTAPWYNNAPRLASIWVIAVLPLAALGASVLASWLLRLRTATAIRRFSARMPLVVPAVLAALLVVVTQNGAIRQAAADIEFTYQVREAG